MLQALHSLWSHGPLTYLSFACGWWFANMLQGAAKWYKISGHTQPPSCMPQLAPNSSSACVRGKQCMGTVGPHWSLCCAQDFLDLSLPGAPLGPLIRWADDNHAGAVVLLCPSRYLCTVVWKGAGNQEQLLFSQQQAHGPGASPFGHCDF